MQNCNFSTNTEKLNPEDVQLPQLSGTLCSISPLLKELSFNTQVVLLLVLNFACSQQVCCASSSPTFQAPLLEPPSASGFAPVSTQVGANLPPQVLRDLLRSGLPCKVLPMLLSV